MDFNYIYLFLNPKNTCYLLFGGEKKSDAGALLSGLGAFAKSSFECLEITQHLIWAFHATLA